MPPSKGLLLLKAKVDEYRRKATTIDEGLEKVFPPANDHMAVLGDYLQDKPEEFHSKMKPHPAVLTPDLKPPHTEAWGFSGSFPGNNNLRSNATGGLHHEWASGHHVHLFSAGPRPSDQNPEEKHVAWHAIYTHRNGMDEHNAGAVNYGDQIRSDLHDSPHKALAHLGERMANHYFLGKSDLEKVSYSPGKGQGQFANKPTKGAIIGTKYQSKSQQLLQDVKTNTTTGNIRNPDRPKGAPAERSMRGSGKGPLKAEGSLFAVGAKRSPKLAGYHERTLYSYGGHWPVVQHYPQHKTLVVNSHDYGGQTKLVVDTLKREIPKHFPEHRVVEVDHPDYQEAARVMRSGSLHVVHSHLKRMADYHNQTAEALGKDPEVEQETVNHHFDAARRAKEDADHVGHVLSLKKAQFTRQGVAFFQAMFDLQKARGKEAWRAEHRTASSNAKRQRQAFTREPNSDEVGVHRLNRYLHSIGLHAETGEPWDPTKGMGRRGPNVIESTAGEGPHRAQLVHEAGHVTQTPVGSTIAEYQRNLGQPGDRKAAVESGLGRHEEGKAKHAEAGVSRRAGLPPFKRLGPEYVGKPGSLNHAAMMQGRHNVRALDTGINRFEPETGKKVVGTDVHARINMRAAGMPHEAMNILRQKLAEHRGIKKSDVLEKMAIRDIKPGEKIPFSQDVARPEGRTYNYNHVLSAKHRQGGYSLTVRHHATDEEGNQHTTAEVTHRGQYVGGVSGYVRDHDGNTLTVEGAEIKGAHRGKGLGLAVYEGLYAHAHHQLGAKRVSGGTHSTMASQVHRRLAEKHGMSYKPKRWRHGSTPEAGPYDDRYKPYSYVIKTEGLAKAKGSGLVDEQGAAELHRFMHDKSPHGWQHSGARIGSQMVRYHEDPLKPFHDNVARKVKSGKYDHSKAPKLWSHAVDRAAKDYADSDRDVHPVQAMMGARPWHHQFNTATRKHLAQRLADEGMKHHFAEHPVVQQAFPDAHERFKGMHPDMVRHEVNRAFTASGYEPFFKSEALVKAARKPAKEAAQPLEWQPWRGRVGDPSSNRWHAPTTHGDYQITRGYHPKKQGYTTSYYPKSGDFPYRIDPRGAPHSVDPTGHTLHATPEAAQQAAAHHHAAKHYAMNAEDRKAAHTAWPGQGPARFLGAHPETVRHELNRAHQALGHDHLIKGLNSKGEPSLPRKGTWAHHHRQAQLGGLNPSEHQQGSFKVEAAARGKDYKQALPLNWKAETHGAIHHSADAYHGDYTVEHYPGSTTDKPDIQVAYHQHSDQSWHPLKGENGRLKHSSDEEAKNTAQRHHVIKHFGFKRHDVDAWNKAYPGKPIHSLVNAHPDMVRHELNRAHAALGNEHLVKTDAGDKNLNASIQNKLSNALLTSAIPVRVFGHVKSLEALHHKVERKQATKPGYAPEDAQDIYRGRVNVVSNDLKDVRRVADTIRQHFSVDEANSPDYLADPTSPYSRVHLVLHEGGVPFELQIGTQDLHDYYETNPAHSVHDLVYKNPDASPDHRQEHEAISTAIRAANAQGQSYKDNDALRSRVEKFHEVLRHNGNVVKALDGMPGSDTTGSAEEEGNGLNPPGPDESPRGVPDQQAVINGGRLQRSQWVELDFFKAEASEAKPSALKEGAKATDDKAETKAIAPPKEKRSIKETIAMATGTLKPEAFALRRLAYRLRLHQKRQGKIQPDEVRKSEAIEKRSKNVREKVRNANADTQRKRLKQFAGAHGIELGNRPSNDFDWSGKTPNRINPTGSHDPKDVMHELSHALSMPHGRSLAEHQTWMDRIKYKPQGSKDEALMIRMEPKIARRAGVKPVDTRNFKEEKRKREEGWGSEYRSAIWAKRGYDEPKKDKKFKLSSAPRAKKIIGQLDTGKRSIDPSTGRMVVKKSEAIEKRSKNVRRQTRNISEKQSVERVEGYATRLGLESKRNHREGAYFQAPNKLIWRGPKIVGKPDPKDEPYRPQHVLTHEIAHAINTPKGISLNSRQTTIDNLPWTASKYEEGVTSYLEPKIARRAGVKPVDTRLYEKKNRLRVPHKQRAERVIGEVDAGKRKFDPKTGKMSKSLEQLAKRLLAHKDKKLQKETQTMGSPAGGDVMTEMGGIG